MRRLLAMAMTMTLAGGVLPVATQAAENRPPVAVDDPSLGPDGCQPFDHWGGAFPLPEDYHGGWPEEWAEWFAWFGDCGPLANDVDPDGDPLTLELVGQPPHGEALWVDVDPVMLGYRPDPDWSTPPGDVPGGTWTSDLITYRASDGQASSDPAVFRVWVSPVNDPPSFTPGADTVEGAAFGAAVSVPWATAILPGPPNESDQQVTFEVEADAAPGVFAVAPAIDQAGILTFTPGTEPALVTVAVTARDDGGLEDWGMGPGTMDPPDDTSDTVAFDIVIGPAAPAPPVVADDTLEVAEDTAGIVNVLANDRDPNDDPMLVVDHGAATKGTVEYGGSGELVYTPDADANGSDSFTYLVDDSVSGTATGTVAVTIRPVNDPPVAVPDGVAIAEGAGPTTIDVLGNDTDVDGDALVVAAVGEAAHGSVTLAAGTVRYSPAAGYTGPDAFAYTIRDVAGEPATTDVSITVDPDAVAPVLGALDRTIALGASRRDTVRVRLGWSATDGGSGVASYELQRRRAGGAWTPVALPVPQSLGITLPLAAGETVAFRVRATDVRGNASAWSAWPTFVPRHREERTSAASWVGRWRVGTNRALSGGRDRRTGGSGRRVAYTFTGTAIGWVGRLGASGGSARVWIDGVSRGTVSSRASATTWRVVLFAAELAPGRHRIEIRPLGDGRVDVDAFVVLP